MLPQPSTRRRFTKPSPAAPRRPPGGPPLPYSICRDVVAGKPCITVVPQGAAAAAGLREILVARSFQSAFRKAMDLAGWSGPVRLDTEEPTP